MNEKIGAKPGMINYYSDMKPQKNNFIFPNSIIEIK